MIPFDGQGEALFVFYSLQPLSIIRLLRLMLQRPERDRFPVIGNLLQAGRPAVRQHEIALGDPELLGCFFLAGHYDAKMGRKGEIDKGGF